MLSQIQRQKVVDTSAEPILLLLLRLEEDSPQGISLAKIKVAASKANPNVDIYKATYALRSIGFMRSVPSTSIAEGEARLAKARRELAKSPAAIDVSNSRLTYQLTDLGRHAGIFLLGQRSVMDCIAKQDLEQASLEELEVAVSALRKKFYRKLFNRVKGKSVPV